MSSGAVNTCCDRSRPRLKNDGEMAPILTPQDVVRRIAAECAYVDERGGGIRLEPGAAIARALKAIIAGFGYKPPSQSPSAPLAIR